MAATWVVKPSASASPESSVLSLLEAALVDYIGLLGSTSSPTVNSPSRKGSSERSCALRVDPVHDHVHVRVSTPVRHDQRLVLLQPQRLQALRRLPGLNAAAPAPHPWPSYSHMDAIWTPQRISSPYTTIELAVKYLLFMHLLQCPARDSNPEPTD